MSSSTVELDQERRLLLLRQKQLLEKRLRVKRENGLAFYTPFAKQDAFHRSLHKHRMVRSGNRFGKSTMGCCEDLAWLIGERPWIPRTDPARTAGIPQRPNKGLVITTDWDKVNEIWTSQGGRGTSTGKIWQFAPNGYIRRTRRNHSGAIEELEGQNGSILRFDTVESFKKNPQGSESSDWDFVHVDEPCPEQMYKAAARGLMDRGGRDWFTLTPLTEFWINDLFFPAPGCKSPFLPGSVWALQGSTDDNPFLKLGDIEEYFATLNPEEIECRRHGLPLELSGLVYKTFKFDKHVLQKIPAGWIDYNTPPANYIIYCSIDVHPQTPHAVLFVAVSPHGQRFIFDELFVKCSSEELAKLVLSKLRNWFYTQPKCDPLAWINDPITESCIAEDFGRYGLFVEKASKSKTHGILKMMGEFQKENNIYVSPNLQRFLYEINRYCYDKENKPIDKDDHLMECMYRIFINDPVWFDPDRDSAPVKALEITGADTTLPELTLD